MSARKCSACGLVGFETDQACRRCGTPLGSASAVQPPATSGPEARGIGRRLLWLLLVLIGVIFGWSRSLLLTSEPIDDDQREIVMRSVTLLEHTGYSREVLALRHFANYRATDNWWNLHQGHSDAYAATNFPLGVLTLYRPFFTVAVDDVERAAILCHEAQHLLGSGEEAALERVWREKARLGWTADKYSGTRVWKNVREWTATEVPALFTCGPDHQSDCTASP